MQTNYIASIVIIVLMVVFYKIFKGNFKKELVLKKRKDQYFTHDLTEEAKKNVMDPVIGREKEINRLIHILSRRRKNNPLLVGPPGVGKTAIVEGFAKKVILEDVPEKLKKKKIMALNLGDLLSGTAMRGALEKKFQAMINKMEEKPGTVIMFIDEIHMLSQATGAEGGLDLADMIKPPLARGDISVIGATTMQEYMRSIKEDSALDRRFQPIFISEPSISESIEIINGLKPIFEKFHEVTINKTALESAVKLSDKKIKDRFLPDKALDVIDEACAKVHIEHSKKKGKKAKKPSVKITDIKEVVACWGKINS